MFIFNSGCSSFINETIYVHLLKQKFASLVVHSQEKRTEVVCILNCSFLIVKTKTNLKPSDEFLLVKMVLHQKHFINGQAT